MSLSRIRSAFSVQTRRRAEAYVADAEVREAGTERVHAHVLGTEEYCVVIERRPRSLVVSCSCPMFEREACKHVWAVLQREETSDAIMQSPAIRALELEDLPCPSEAPRSSARTAPRPAAPPRPPEWDRALAELAHPTPLEPEPIEPVLYVITPAGFDARPPGLAVSVEERVPRKDGTRGKPRPLRLSSTGPWRFTDPTDAELVPWMIASTPIGYGFDRYDGSETLEPRTRLVAGTVASQLPKILATGRAYLRDASRRELVDVPLRWDPGSPFKVHLGTEDHPEQGGLRLVGELRRGRERRDLRQLLHLLPDGLALFYDGVARIELSPAEARLVELLRSRQGQLWIPTADLERFSLRLYELLGALPLPEALRVEEVPVEPRPVLRIGGGARPGAPHEAELSFLYGERSIGEHDAGAFVSLDGGRRVSPRAQAIEAAARDRLLGLRARRLLSYSRVEVPWLIAPAQVAELAWTLVREGWDVAIEGQPLRRAGEVEVSTESGVDWFDLRVEVAYGALRVGLPELLAAARRGQRFVQLADGSLGELPEAWLDRHRLLPQVGRVEGEALRFGRAQIGVLGALLDEMPTARIDAQLARARARLARFQRIEPSEAPRGFVGALRPYQQLGLGWLRFLADLGFGGCLADDMGLGKTVQVLALLVGARGRPSLVVAPRSLLFNWRAEAARFAPGLRVLEHHGAARDKTLAGVDGADLVITTYQTLVRDAEAFAARGFAWVILDEAQQVKNPRTEAARAVRRLRGDHRLALTGTPIENRLADLWSLFDFLNPGMLGGFGGFAALGKGQVLDEAARRVLAEALRPFLLRRTKAQVARDLPPRTEQVLYCELDREERRRYDELRAHYRQLILGLVDDKGLQRSKIQVLEALLRLRQAACHPGLLDEDRATARSAKLELLLEQLDEVIAEGGKALVFSQFTSLLDLVEARLDEAGIASERLDGRTRDRQRRIARFQSDPSVPVFLLSLKAGGVGLNLTAAEYVFLLDPWWNPAVEAQAIDRTHRIGQQRPVFAYRLIGRDTVEEKVLELQAHKRALADSILHADDGFLASLDRAALERLLS